jgi:hypothetical protein
MPSAARRPQQPGRQLCLALRWASRELATGSPGTFSPAALRHSARLVRGATSVVASFLLEIGRGREGVALRQCKQHFLNFLPLPHGHGPFRPTFAVRETESFWKN